MPESVRAVVLGRIAYGDHDLVVPVLSAEEGRMSVFAQRPRSKKKRWYALLVPGNTVDLRFSPRRRGDMPSLSQVDLVTDRSTAMSEPMALARAAYFIELAALSTRDGLIAPSLTRALELALDALDQAQTSRWMELQVLRHLGVEPDPDHCARCASDLSHGAALDPMGHGLTCRNCSHAGRHYPRPLLDRLRHLGETVVPLGGDSDRELGVLLSRALRSQLGVLKSAKVAVALAR
jgi:DNA repair protein RecO (recombination protein O)